MKYLVTLSNFRTGQCDYYVIYTENKLENNLFSAIDDEYLELYRDKYYLDYELGGLDIEEGFEEYLRDMSSEIDEWTDEIEERFSDNLPILYNEDSSN